MTVMVSAAALLFATHARAADPAAKVCAKPTTLQVMQLMNLWKAGLASGDADKMASFYAPDATIVTTKDAAPIKGRDAIRAYFADLLPRHPQPRFISSNIKTACSGASVQGVVIYRITGTRKGTRHLLGGRYAVDFSFDNKVWHITKQSLAANPRKLGEPIASL
jgi:uncharacterized protein (TIGR02246 family)